MKNSHLIGAVCAVLFSFVSVSANATLHGRLPLTPGGTDYQAAYDDVLDITWATNAALSGDNIQDNQVAWAANLDYLGFDDWRLASMSVSAGLPTGTAASVVDCSVSTELACRDNELGYMFYQNMGGSFPVNKTGDQSVDGVLLTDVKAGYWSGTEDFKTCCQGQPAAWYFFYTSGWQYSSFGEGGNDYGWAVRAGDVPHTLIDNGDTTIDTASRLEWLDLTFTQGVSAQVVLAGFGGYIDAGWTFATVEQVCGLFEALGDDTTNCTTGAAAVQMDPANAETFVNLLGNTAATGRGAYGMFNNIGGPPNNFSLGCINDTATSCTMGRTSSWLTKIGWGSGYKTVGSFLVRPASTTTLIDNGYTTIDTASGLEWLDLTFTQGVSAQDVLAGFSGYIEDGWTFALVHQVCGLFGALADDTTNCTNGAVAVQMNPTNAKTLVNLLGSTAANGRGGYGMFNNSATTMLGRLPLIPGGTDYQAAYDTVLDITWVTNAALSGTKLWDDQVAWASGLNYLGFDDWRLASMDVNGDTAVVGCNGANELACRDNELGYMFYQNMGGSFGENKTGDQTVDGILLTDVQVNYWSGTEFDSSSAWSFGNNAGTQSSGTLKNYNALFGWAVRAGDVVPHTPTVIDSFPDSFGIGCINDTATSCTQGGTNSWLTQIEWGSGYTTVGSFLVREFSEPPPTTLIDNGYTTIDTASGLEWLDLTFTQGVSAQDVLSGFGGYIEDGWKFATVEQVCGLFGALGDDTTNCTTGAVAMQMNPTKSETLVNLLGNTAATGRGAYGMFDNLGGFPGNFGIGCINDTDISCTMGGASSWLTQIEWAGGYTTVGSYLVRDYIEPASTILMTYSSRAFFEADYDDLVIEDFEEANIAAATDVQILGPLDATSDDGVFAPGDIAAGLVINEYPEGTEGELGVYGDSYSFSNEIILPGVSTTQISFIDTGLLHLMFAAGVQSVGFDVFNLEANLEIVARVYSGATLLDTITVRGSGTGTSFFLGVASDEAITRVSLDPSDDLYFSVDNVTFNSVETFNGLVPPGLIDIKPLENRKNVIDLKKDSELKVAIVGATKFDALQVDPTTIKFGPIEAGPVSYQARDYNRDGFSDLILIFNLSEAGIACGDTKATLTGETYSGEAIQGSDSFTVKRCRSKTRQ